MTGRNSDHTPGRYNTSLAFPSLGLAAASDGAGTLHLLETAGGGGSRWRPLYSGQVCGDGRCFLVVDARTEPGREVHCLLRRVEQAVGGRFKTVLEWVTLAEGGGAWSLASVRRLSGAGGADYAAFEPGCRCVYLASESRFEFVVDSARPVEMLSPLEPDEEKKCLSWAQTGGEITAWLPTPAGVATGDVGVTVGEDSVRVTCRGETLLEGHSWRQLDSAHFSWSVDQRNVELKLTKAEPGIHWPELVKEAVEGEEIVADPSLVDPDGLIARLTSDTEVTEEDSAVGRSPGFNSEQLEDCDSLPDMLQLMRLDTRSHAVTHQINLGGHQWLFSARLNPDKAPALCLRFDIDGCLWQVAPPVADSGDWPCVHAGTFLAFGYVQASKTQRKFTVCSPDLSFVAICEANRHIYLYRQPSPVDGQLRNRKSGKNVGQVAKQQLITLDSGAEVLGVHASNTTIYVLTASMLYTLQVNV